MRSNNSNKVRLSEKLNAIDFPESSSKFRNNVVIYNRVPKTGSTSLMQLPYELCNQLKYNVLLLNITGGPRSYTMTLKDRMAFAWNITGTCMLDAYREAFYLAKNFSYLFFIKHLYFNRCFIVVAWKEKHPAVYHGHFAFIDTYKLPVNHQTNVININMIRKPIDRYAYY